MGNQSLILPLTERFKYRPLSSITTEVVKRNDWSSGLRKRNPGSVEYQRPATVQSMILAHVKCKTALLIQYKVKDVFRLR